MRWLKTSATWASSDGPSIVARAALSRAAVAVGADGLIVEVHHDPDKALSDGIQSLYPEQFEELMAQVRQIAPVVGRTVPAIGTHAAVGKTIGVQAGVRPAAS